MRQPYIEGATALFDIKCQTKIRENIIYNHLTAFCHTMPLMSNCADSNCIN